MKVLTKEEEEEHYRATVKGGLKGAVIGLGVSLGLSLVAQRYSPFYQKLTLPLKAFLVSYERASLNYERKKYGYYQPVKELHQKLPTTQVVKDFISENRYGIVCGSWALCMAGSLAYTYRNKYLTFPQKLVQARMYAQALTIIMVLATAGLSMSPKQPKIPVGSDLWREMVDAEEIKMKHIQEIKDHK
ncbi:21229_t:CDS:2 [Dentiscutata erythropus]|uniref:21229_t:CDS:1 n=1 Tax=Dentiscutata erythropus TaxID=1348616 RepID=A0A9N9GX27_9GLOM|nr:21229_t:CDS:2 [Dentiscutata erythropus]